MNKITNKHFELFKKEHNKHLQKLGLLGWITYFKFEESNRGYAHTDINFLGRVAVITLSTNWENREPTNDSITKCAKHEANHLLLTRLSSYAEDRFINRENIEEAEEEIVRILDRLL